MKSESRQSWMILPKILNFINNVLFKFSVYMSSSLPFYCHFLLLTICKNLPNHIFSRLRTPSRGVPAGHRDWEGMVCGNGLIIHYPYWGMMIYVHLVHFAWGVLCNSDSCTRWWVPLGKLCVWITADCRPYAHLHTHELSFLILVN